LEESSFEVSDPDERKEIEKIKKQAKKRSASNAERPKIAKAPANSKKKNVPEEYLKVIAEPEAFEMLDTDPIQESEENELINTECCTNCINKNVFRAAKNQNIELLKKCIKATDKISKILIT
jgi:hypothetical protein